jgi:hypothetical protein
MPTEGGTDAHEEACLGAVRDYAKAPVFSINFASRPKNDSVITTTSFQKLLALYVEAFAMPQNFSSYPEQRPGLLSDSIMMIVQRLRALLFHPL